MKVSILTITRNDLAGVTRTLDSVRGLVAEAGVEVEHVVVDSSDAAVAKQVQVACGKDTVYSWSAPKSIYPAMNSALALSTGDVIGILNGGDVFADAWAVTRVVDALRQSGSDYVLSDVIFTNSRRYYAGDDFTVKAMESGIAPPHPAFYARRKVYEALGNFNENYTIVADFDFFCRLVKHPEYCGTYVHGPLVVMESGGASQTLRNRLGRNTCEKYRALKENGLRASLLRLYFRFFRILYFQFK